MNIGSWFDLGLMAGAQSADYDFDGTLFDSALNLSEIEL